jgi:hypothetical protein
MRWRDGESVNQLYLNFTGRALRDSGMKVARLNADSRVLGWSELALGYLKEFICVRPEFEFTGEDVRLFAESKGFHSPASKRVWGSVMMSAAKQGIIRKVGTAPVKNPRAHMAFASVWRRVL